MGSESFVDDEGDRWFQADEYGDKSYMWEYIHFYLFLHRANTYRNDSSREGLKPLLLW